MLLLLYENLFHELKLEGGIPMEVDKDKKGNTVQAVERTLAILEVLAEEGVPMNLSDISQKVQLNISTVHRLLNTLISRDFVQQDHQNSKYRLGLKAFEVGNAALYTLDIRATAKPYLKELVEQCNETANLVILDGYEVVYIDQVESTSIIKMFAKLGSRGPAHCTGSGKVLLSSLSEKELDLLYGERPLRKYTQKTIATLELMKKELQKIKQQGYAVDDEELEEGVRCISAPIRNHEGKITAALSVSGPTARITTACEGEKLIDTIRETANKISAKLGYLP